MTRAGSTVVFDFDGTLVGRDSFLDFATRYCLRRPARVLLLVAMLPLAALLRLRSSRAALSALLWAITIGTSTRSFVVALQRYAARTLARCAHEAIFQELHRHLQAGDRVVIATGSLPVLVHGLFRARRLAYLPVVGSRMKSRWGGLVVDTHCVGRTKPRELERRLGIVEWSTLYTDSFADRSLMRRARDITLVGPNPRTLACTRRLIDAGTRLRVLPPA
jgi:phosphatidylglycerophosphatase C